MNNIKKQQYREAYLRRFHLSLYFVLLLIMKESISFQPLNQRLYPSFCRRLSPYRCTLSRCRLRFSVSCDDTKLIPTLATPNSRNIMNDIEIFPNNELQLSKFFAHIHETIISNQQIYEENMSWCENEIQNLTEELASLHTSIREKENLIHQLKFNHTSNDDYLILRQHNHRLHEELTLIQKDFQRKELETRAHVLAEISQIQTTSLKLRESITRNANRVLYEKEQLINRLEEKIFIYEKERADIRILLLLCWKKIIRSCKYKFCM